MFDAEHRPGQVDIDGSVPRFKQGGIHPLTADGSGVVHQHVQLAEGALGKRHRLGPLRLEAHVERGGDDPPARSTDGIDEVGEAFPLHIGHDHRAALAREVPCIFGPLPAGSTGDQRYFVLKASHGFCVSILVI